MNTQQAAALLAVAAAFDNRKPDADAATAWGIALDGYRFDDCRAAIVAHYRAGTDWLMPHHVITGVKRIRNKRLADFGEFPDPPRSINPDDTQAIAAWKRDTVRAIADGERVEVPVAVAGVTPDNEARQTVLDLRRAVRAGERTSDLAKEDA